MKQTRHNLFDTTIDIIDCFINICKNHPKHMLIDKTFNLALSEYEIDEEEAHYQMSYNAQGKFIRSDGGWLFQPS